MKYAFDLVKSDRKTISLQIRPDGKITVRAPLNMPYGKIVKYVEEKSDWIEKTLQKCKGNDENALPPLTNEELNMLADKAMAVIPPIAKKYALLLDVTYGKITIRNQKTRWGSCSSKGNLNFNCLLMLMPPKVMESVIVHELCHRKEMNHSKRFYDEVLKVFPDYYECEDWLHQNGNRLMARLYN